jgi:hypothetical protein
MFWLSGGFYPQTWQLFLQACIQFSLLWSQQGVGALFPFAVLTIQSLLLAMAWGFLLWLALREIYEMFVARRKPAAVPLSVAINSQQSMQGNAPSSPSYAQAQDALSLQEHVNRTENPFQPVASPSSNGVLGNPFEEPEPSDSVKRSQGVQEDQVQPETLAPPLTQQNDQLSQLFHHELEDIAASTIIQQNTSDDNRQEIRAHRQEDEYEEVFLRPSQDERDDPSGIPASEQENVNFSSALYELGFFRPGQSPTGDQPATSQAEVEQPEAQPSSANKDPDQLYVLGNPFEGQLPEVFQQDEDLKHTVLEQVSKELEQRTSQRKRVTREGSSPGSEKKVAKRSLPKKSD